MLKQIVYQITTAQQTPVFGAVLPADITGFVPVNTGITAKLENFNAIGSVWNTSREFNSSTGEYKTLDDIPNASLLAMRTGSTKYDLPNAIAGQPVLGNVPVGIGINPRLRIQSKTGTTIAGYVLVPIVRAADGTPVAGVPVELVIERVLNHAGYAAFQASVLRMTIPLVTGVAYLILNTELIPTTEIVPTTHQTLSSETVALMHADYYNEVVVGSDLFMSPEVCYEYPGKIEPCKGLVPAMTVAYRTPDDLVIADTSLYTDPFTPGLLVDPDTFMGNCAPLVSTSAGISVDASADQSLLLQPLPRLDGNVSFVAPIIDVAVRTKFLPTPDSSIDLVLSGVVTNTVTTLAALGLRNYL